MPVWWCIWLCSGMRAIQSPNFLSIDGDIWSRGESLLGEANEIGNIGYFCSTQNFLVCPFTYQKHLVLLLCFLYYPMNSTHSDLPLAFELEILKNLSRAVLCVLIGGGDDSFASLRFRVCFLFLTLSGNGQIKRFDNFFCFFYFMYFQFCDNFLCVCMCVRRFHCVVW